MSLKDENEPPLGAEGRAISAGGRNCKVQRSGCKREKECVKGHQCDRVIGIRGRKIGSEVGYPCKTRPCGVLEEVFLGVL